jgi:hypothetical protein
LRKLSNSEFLIHSDEFSIFSRPNGDIEKMLARIGKPPTISIIDRMRKVLNINETRYDTTDKEMFHTIVIEYAVFAKKVLTQMKLLKKNIEAYQSVKDQSIAHNKIFYNLIDKYEELNLTDYLDGKNEGVLVFADPNGNDLKEQSDLLAENL